MEFLSTVFSFLIVIGILVLIHELGHYLTAMWTGMRADVFALGMGPRMLGWNKLNGFTFGPLPDDMELEDKTDFRICWLPIGGYVRILGMIDESFDTSFKDQEAQPWEFRSKKNWQKTIVLVAGVVMNLLLAVGVFWALPFINGQEEMRTTTVAWVEPGTSMYEAGVRDNDKIISIDGKPIETWNEVMTSLGLENQNSDRQLSLERDGAVVNRTIPAKAIIRSLADGDGLGIYPSGVQTIIGPVVSFKPADEAGLLPGDVMLAVDSLPVRAVPQLQRYIRAHAGENITLHIDRDGETMPVAVQVGEDSAIGITIEMRYVGKRSQRSYGFAEAGVMAVEEVGSTIGLIGTSVGHVISGDVSVRQSFGGPVKIAKMASRSQELGAEAFLRFMALISISLAVMNLLPLPGLDGGHLVFVGIEAIIRREIPTSIKIRFQQIGIAILLGLMAIIFYLDLT